MNHRTPLPTKAQINALNDKGALEALADDIEATACKIATDLEFIQDDEWAARARSALALHRHTVRLIKRRLYTLNQDAGKTEPRPDDACDPLTIEALRSAPQIDVAGLRTVEDVDAKQAWLVTYIDAVTTDREDEIGLPGHERDERFLAATGRVLRHMKALRSNLQIRRGQITRETRQASATQHQPTRERLFIEASREVLDKDVYLSIWELVDRRAA